MAPGGFSQRACSHEQARHVQEYAQGAQEGLMRLNILLFP